jgi:hypothetical protein
MVFLGACEVLWQPFIGGNPGYCDPSAPQCTSENSDGGSRHHDGGGPASSTDGGSGGGDMRPSNRDMACDPGAPGTWTADTPPSTTFNLFGVSDGNGDTWIFGGSYAAIKMGNVWSPITLTNPSTSHLTVAGYSPSDSLVLTVDTGSDTDVFNTTQEFGEPYTLSNTTFLSFWTSSSPNQTLYSGSMVPTGGMVYKWKNGTILGWFALGTMLPYPVSSLAGNYSGGQDTLWAANLTQVSAYSGGSWTAATTAPSNISALWASPASDNLLWAVGPGGTIMRGMQGTQPTLVQLSSPTSTSLLSVAGTSDGQHVFAVGMSGTIVHWDGPCDTLQIETTPATSQLNSIFIDEKQNLVWAVGNSGTVLHRPLP